MQKLIKLGLAGAMLLGAVGPALATGGWWWWWGGDKDIAIVSNYAGAVSDTGGNSQSNIADVTHGGGVTVNGAGGNRTINTGTAKSYAGALVVANTHVGCCDEPDDCCPPATCVDLVVDECCPHTDYADVENGAQAGAYTGDNYQDDAAIVRYGGGVKVNGGGGHRVINSNWADSESHAWTVVNTHLEF